MAACLPSLFRGRPQETSDEEVVAESEVVEDADHGSETSRLDGIPGVLTKVTPAEEEALKEVLSWGGSVIERGSNQEEE